MRQTLFAVLGALALLGPAARGEETDADRRDAALVKAFGFLDDALPKMTVGGSPRKPYSEAAAGLAYLLASDKEGGRRLPSRVRETKAVFDSLQRYVEEVGRLYESDRKGTVTTSQYNWPLGIAAIFFAESHARGARKGEARKALAAIVKILEASQQADGGWGHDDPPRTGLLGPEFPIPKPGGGTLTYPNTLFAATNCAAAGLGLAHAALKTKDPESIRKAVGYYRKGQNADGTFPYDPSQRRSDALELGMGLPTGRGSPSLGEVARTTGAVFALSCLGTGLAEAPAAAAAKMVDGAPEEWSEGHGSATMALSFSALLAAARGGDSWATFHRIYLPRILDAQQEDGSFLCACRASGPAVTCDTRPIPGLPDGAWTDEQRIYVTAIHALILTLDRARPAAVPRIEGASPAETAR